jgi:hypothetical protein
MGDRELAAGCHRRLSLRSYACCAIHCPDHAARTLPPKLTPLHASVDKALAQAVLQRQRPSEALNAARSVASIVEPSFRRAASQAPLGGGSYAPVLARATASMPHVAASGSHVGAGAQRADPVDPLMALMLHHPSHPACVRHAPLRSSSSGIVHGSDDVGAAASAAAASSAGAGSSAGQPANLTNSSSAAAVVSDAGTSDSCSGPLPCDAEGGAADPQPPLWPGDGASAQARADFVQAVASFLHASTVDGKSTNGASQVLLWLLFWGLGRQCRRCALRWHPLTSGR